MVAAGSPSRKVGVKREEESSLWKEMGVVELTEEEKQAARKAAKEKAY